MTNINADAASVNPNGECGSGFHGSETAGNGGSGQAKSSSSYLAIDFREIRDFVNAIDADNEPDPDKFSVEGLFASFDDDADRAEAMDEYIWQPHVQAIKAELNKKRDALKADPNNAQLKEEVAGLERAQKEIYEEAPGFGVEHKYGVLDRGMRFWMEQRTKKGCNICLTIQAMEPGKKRLKKLFTYGRAVFVEDDEKRDAPRTDWPLPPSWINQSSPGKFHYYWFVQFSTALDRDTIEAIQRHMAEKHGSDPACIDAARVLRVPGSWNQKKGRPAFQVKAIDKNGKRYTAEEILAAFPPIRVEKAKPRPGGFQAQGEMSRFTEPGNPLDYISSDEEFTWMQVGWGLHHESGGSAEGLRIWEDWSSTSSKYREGECARKWAAMKCGGGITGGVIYAMAKDAGWRREDLEAERERAKAREGKGKKARNPHREKSSQKAKADHHEDAKSPPPPGGEEPPAGGADEAGKPIIIVEAGEHDQIVAQAMQILVDCGEKLFQRGNKLVRPILGEGVDSKGQIVNFSVLMEVDEAFLVRLLCRNIEWYKPDSRVKKGDMVGFRKIDAPGKVAQAILKSAGDWPFKVIAGILNCPTLRWDGSIIDQQGYDARTHLYLQSAVILPAIPENPTRAEAEAALKLLTDLFVEIPFVNDASRSVGLSFLLSTVARSMFEVAPAHGFRAPTAGTGKSYVADIIAAIVLGERCPVIAVSEDNAEETEKRIIAKAMNGDQIINLDNVNGVIGGDVVCQLTERPTCDLRPLGSSKLVRVENRSIVTFNGNNCRVKGDMTRRVVIAELDRRMEKPAEYRFKNDPVKTVLADRGKYVAAAMTIIKAYRAADAAEKPDVVPMNSYGEWSACIRSALIWLGCTDPCETIQKARDEDPELQKVAQFIEIAKPHVGRAEFALQGRKIIELGTKTRDHGFGNHEPINPELNEFVSEYIERGKPNYHKFGNWLAKFKGRVVDGMRINSVWDASKRVHKWFVEAVEGPEFASA